MALKTKTIDDDVIKDKIAEPTFNKDTPERLQVAPEGDKYFHFSKIDTTNRVNDIVKFDDHFKISAYSKDLGDLNSMTRGNSVYHQHSYPDIANMFLSGSKAPEYGKNKLEDPYGMFGLPTKEASYELTGINTAPKTIKEAVEEQDTIKQEIANKKVSRHKQFSDEFMQELDKRNRREEDTKYSNMEMGIPKVRANPMGVAIQPESFQAKPTETYQPKQKGIAIRPVTQKITMPEETVPSTEEQTNVLKERSQRFEKLYEQEQMRRTKEHTQKVRPIKGASVISESFQAKPDETYQPKQKGIAIKPVTQKKSMPKETITALPKETVPFTEEQNNALKARSKRLEKESKRQKVREAEAKAKTLTKMDESQAKSLAEKALKEKASVNKVVESKLKASKALLAKAKALKEPPAPTPVIQEVLVRPEDEEANAPKTKAQKKINKKKLEEMKVVDKPPAEATEDEPAVQLQHQNIFASIKTSDVGEFFDEVCEKLDLFLDYGESVNEKKEDVRISKENLNDLRAVLLERFNIKLSNKLTKIESIKNQIAMKLKLK